MGLSRSGLDFCEGLLWLNYTTEAVALSIEKLVLEIQAGNLGLKNELWEHIKGIVIICCRRYRDCAQRRGYDLDDLICTAWFGVERAILAYRPEKGYRFATYLSHHIANAVRELLGLRGTKSVEATISLDDVLTDDSDTTYSDMLEDESAAEPFEAVERDELCSWVRARVEELEHTQRDIIHGMYWDNLSRAEIARQKGLTAAKVAQLQHTALIKLRRTKEMQEYYREFCYRHVGLDTFKTTWTSSTEWAAIKRQELTEGQEAASQV